jgi:hypothetical protein
VNDLNRRSAAQSRNAVPQEVSGVLETLAAGFSLVLSRPYLFVLPLVIDLWTWLGIQIHPSSLVSSLQTMMLDYGDSNGPAAAEELGRLGERFRVNDTLASLTPSVFAGLPNDTFLSTLVGLLAPALTEGVDRSDMYATWGEGLGRHVTPGNGYAVVGLAFSLFLGATVLLALFKVPIAHAVRGGNMTPGTFVKDVAIGWMRVIALVAIALTTFVGIGLPLFVVAALISAIGINLIALVSLVLFVFGSVGALYMYFLLDAMFIYRVGPVRAAKMSYAVARMNFAQSWRFAAASLLIATGVLHVWGVIVENPPGIIVALIANAVLGTGLSIASMMFFHDRARLPRPTFPSRTISASRRF